MSERDIEHLIYGGVPPRVKLRRRLILLALFIAGMAGSYIIGALGSPDPAQAHGTCSVRPEKPYFSQGVVKGIGQLVCSIPHHYAEVHMQLIRTPVLEEKVKEATGYHNGRFGGQMVNTVYATTKMPCYRNWQYRVVAWGKAGPNSRHTFGPSVSE